MRNKEELERVTGDLQSLQEDYDAQRAENRFMETRLEEHQAELAKCKQELTDAGEEIEVCCVCVV